MRLRLRIALAFATLSLVAGATEVSADVISQWNFGTVESAPYNSPAASIGSGTATVLGMDSTTYVFSSNNTITGTGTFIPGTIITTGSSASADILATSGAPSGDPNTWRVRGSTGPDGSGNGWNLAAPQYSQGAQFSSSTAGYTNIGFHFDWFTTTQGVLNLQEQYTTNGSTWININSPLTAVSNGFYPSTLTIDFSGISGANNDPNFGVRLVSAYDNALQFPNYGSADGGQGGYYNNNSGNWRFTNVGFTGSAVPEPSTLILSLIGGGLVGLIVLRKRGK